MAKRTKTKNIYTFVNFFISIATVVSIGVCTVSFLTLLNLGAGSSANKAFESCGTQQCSKKVLETQQRRENDFHNTFITSIASGVIAIAGMGTNYSKGLMTMAF